MGRYGGEEFVVLFPDTDLSAAMLVAARIDETVRRTLGERLAAGKDRIHASRAAYVGPVPDVSGAAEPIRAARRSTGAE